MWGLRDGACLRNLPHAFVGPRGSCERNSFLPSLFYGVVSLARAILQRRCVQVASSADTHTHTYIHAPPGYICLHSAHTPTLKSTRSRMCDARLPAPVASPPLIPTYGLRRCTHTPRLSAFLSCPPSPLLVQHHHNDRTHRETRSPPHKCLSASGFGAAIQGCLSTRHALRHSSGCPRLCPHSPMTM